MCHSRLTRSVARALTWPYALSPPASARSVIMIAAQYGLPTSSSQCITGGIIGCGLLEGTAGVNWKFFAIQVGGGCHLRCSWQVLARQGGQTLRCVLVCW